MSFRLRRGEILGVTGLLGSGRTEIAESLFGAVPHDSGTMTDKQQRGTHPLHQGRHQQASDTSPEDRLTQGLFMDKSIADNIIAGSPNEHTTRLGTLDLRAVRQTIQGLFDRLRVKAPNVQSPVRTLSGGNAQRVVLAKWLARRPRNPDVQRSDCRRRDRIQGRDSEHSLRAEAAEGMGIIVIRTTHPS